MSTDSFQHVSQEPSGFPVNFKITHASQSLARRLRFTSPPTYASLSKKLTELWQIPPSSLALSYVDSSGDRCVLSSEDELGFFYEELRSEGKEKDVVKMKVVVLEGTTDEQEPQSLSQNKADELPSLMPIQLSAAASPVADADSDSDKVKDDTFKRLLGEKPLDLDQHVPTGPPAFSDGLEGPFPVGDAPLHIGSLPDQARTQENLSDHQSTTLPLLVPVASVVKDSPAAADPPFPSIPTIEVEPEATSAEDISAPDPEEVFPPTLPSEPTCNYPLPSLLADITSLLASFSSSPALATLVHRAASGAYTPHLAAQFASERTHLEEGLHQAKEHVEKAKADVERGLGAGVSGLEALTGLFASVMDGAKEAMEKGREREQERRKKTEDAQKAEPEVEEKTEVLPKDAKVEQKVKEKKEAVAKVDQAENTSTQEKAQSAISATISTTTPSITSSPTTLPPPPPPALSTPFPIVPLDAFPSLFLPKPSAFPYPLPSIPQLSQPHGHPSHVCNLSHPVCAPPSTSFGIPPPTAPQRPPQNLFNPPPGAPPSSSSSGPRFAPCSGPPPLYKGWAGDNGNTSGGTGGSSMPGAFGGFGNSGGAGGLFGRSAFMTATSGQADRERERIVAQRLGEMGFDPSQYELDLIDLSNQEKTEAGLLAAVVRRIVNGESVGKRRV